MRTEKVNKRLVSWEKSLSKLTEYTCAVACPRKTECLVLQWKDALSIWVGPQQRFGATDMQPGQKIVGVISEVLLVQLLYSEGASTLFL